jgi:rhamnose utilization protein RhaD (predicted bifunctional aldolase and dehydrogenase)/NAD(P)-dependent dehydrogenase (short-subunit alcohol dehydrogenase family)
VIPGDLWRDDEANAAMAAAGPDEADRQLALRVYTSRLIGRVPDLVMHGGGNTSVKVRRRDLFGAEIDVLHVKGSGWDLETIEAAGLPGVRMDELLRLRDLDALSDEDMVNVQRCNLLDSTSPNPSVETLLHAYLPHKFVDHTHATEMLALANLPEVAGVVNEIFGDRVALVPYVMPGFALAKRAAEIYESNPKVEGLLLVNHGHFTLGATARESYLAMVTHVAEAAAWFAKRRNAPPARPATRPDPAHALATLRGAMGDARSSATGDARSSATGDARSSNRDAAMPILDLRGGDAVLSFLARDDMAELATRGVATPDHVIRTKGTPLLLSQAELADGKAPVAAKIDLFKKNYEAYFNRNAPNAKSKKIMLNPTPLVAWIPGLGVVGMGSDAAAARVAGDLAEQTLRVMALGEDAGGYRPIGEADLFDMEYWSLEQAKLGKGVAPALQGRVVLITGGAGAIGRATAAAFKARGASVFLVDREEQSLAAALKSLGRDQGGIALDITREGAAKDAMAAAVRRFGGLDILVSNAGAAFTGEVATLDDKILRASLELNFFAHHHCAQAAAAIFRTQGRGGLMLFNVSKQAVNPGKGFAAYGLPKAATFFLVKQLALELGAEGVRVNGINADRIRSGLLHDAFIEERAKARGITPDAYMEGNLLKREVEARHVGEAFVALALAERTTAHVMTVDGGNIEASLR